MSTKQITDDNFQSEIDASSVPVLVDFWAEWCGPCKQIGPVLEEISSEYDGKLSIIKVNIDENPVTPSKYGIRGIPTLLLFKNSELVSTKVGAFPKSSLLEWIDDNI
ncbi:MAG: thioredoxin TrxA [Hyphomicrobiales bacterium]|jgi:thioredoxin 1|nr:thioredoxin TrxA [Hyphomicrobiales bacterium]|tara:strand:- start:954 stop:1274 length:321 start_codon:yes stop_codon:yes gene_type:complete